MQIELLSLFLKTSYGQAISIGQTDQIVILSTQRFTKGKKVVSFIIIIIILIFTIYKNADSGI